MAPNAAGRFRPVFCCWYRFVSSVRLYTISTPQRPSRFFHNGCCWDRYGICGAETAQQKNWNQGLLAFAILIPTLSCLTLLFAWHGWKANWSAIAGVIPISDAASYYESAQTFLREAYLDVSGQRRPLSTAMTSLWLYLSGDHFKLCLLLQALRFAAVAFLAAAAVAVLHGIRAGWVFFALLLVFAEPYLPTMMTESNGIIFGILALSMLLFGLNRGRFPFYCLAAIFFSPLASRFVRPRYLYFRAL